MTTAQQPDQLLGFATERGELLVARIRLALTSLLLLIAVSNLFLQIDSLERLTGLAATLAAVGVSLVAFIAAKRDMGRAWLGMATSCLDVTLVSATLAAYLAIDQPHTAVNSRVVFETYFLAIGATGLRYDPRICIVAGLLR